MKGFIFKELINNIPEPNIILNKLSINILNDLKYKLKNIFNNNKNNNLLNYKKTHKNEYTKCNMFKDIPDDIKNLIEEENKKQNINTTTFSWTILLSNNIKYNIELNINYGNKKNCNLKYINENKKIIKYYILIKTIIEFLISYSKNESRDIKIFLYLTKHIKIIPNKNNNIDWINVNTAFTQNLNTEIVIFRTEEWFKSLIHECIHNLSLDFNDIDKSIYLNKLKHIFKINSDYLLFETYTELWAEIIQILFISILNNNSNICNIIKDELKFSIWQCNKILSIPTNGGEYNDIINNNINVLKLYNENTNAFSYYVLKSIGLYNINIFLNWYNNNNNNILQFNKKKIIQYVNLFEKLYNNKNLINYINIVKNKNKDDSFINKTLRMSIYEIII
jgi:hypothetical protein